MLGRPQGFGRAYLDFVGGDAYRGDCILSWEALIKLLISVPLPRKVTLGCCEQFFFFSVL